MNKDETLFWPADEISVRGSAKSSYCKLILCPNNNKFSNWIDILFPSPFSLLPPSQVCLPFLLSPVFCLPSPFFIFLHQSLSTFSCILSPSLNCITLFFSSVPFYLPCSPSFFSLHPTALLLFPFPSCSLLHYPSFSLLSFSPSPVSIHLLLSSFSLSKLHHSSFSSVPCSFLPSLFSLLL